MPLLLHDVPRTHADTLRAQSLELLRSLWRHVGKLEKLYGRGSFPEGTPDQWRSAIRSVAETVKTAPDETLLEIGANRHILRNMVARAMGFRPRDGTTGADLSVVLDSNW